MAYIGKIIKDTTTYQVGSTLYGTCDTAAGTAAKVAVVNGFDTLETGVTVHIKFTYSNTSTGTITLAIKPSSSGTATTAKNIYKYGTTKPGATAATSWNAGSVVSFTYDGTQWMMNDHLDDTNTQLVTSVAGKTGAVTLSASDVGALASSTKYAGASTAGGAATSAAKLTNTSKIGDTNKPVYFTASGVPTAISYTIDKSVPSTAVFTDANVTQTELGASDTNSYELLLASPGTTTQTTSTSKSQWLTYKPLDYELIVGDESNNLYTKIAYNGATVQTDANSYLHISSSDIRNSATWDGTNEYLKSALADKVSKSQLLHTSSSGYVGIDSIRCGTMISNFTNGSATISFASLGLTTRPEVMLLTCQSQKLAMEYDFDSSTTAITLKLVGSTMSGNVRYSWMIAVKGS